MKNSVAILTISPGENDMPVPELIRFLADRVSTPEVALIAQPEEASVPKLRLSGLSGRPVMLFLDPGQNIVEFHRGPIGWHFGRFGHLSR